MNEEVTKTIRRINHLFQKGEITARTLEAGLAMWDLGEFLDSGNFSSQPETGEDGTGEDVTATPDAGRNETRTGEKKMTSFGVIGMKPGQTEHIGDGVYLHFDGYGFELRANHHSSPTDRVYIDGSCVLTLQRLIRETIEPQSCCQPPTVGGTKL